MQEPREKYRPQFHFSPKCNWINDPNGLIWYEGEYHLFYQYNPFGDQWGHMSWGHAVSRNLIDWEELPVAIAEDERVSIFSGSVVHDSLNTSGFGADGVSPLVAIYTGCLRRNEGGQAQELAYSLDKGRTWTKYAHNPVLDLGLRDFRDPKVFWHEGTGRWIMVVVLPDDRRAQFYASSDLKHWVLQSEFEAPFEGQGIWECPDLIEVAVQGTDKTVWLFKVDALGGHPSGGSHGTGHGARIFIGEFDSVRFKPQAQSTLKWADYGADFYAALSFANLPEGNKRPLWLAWMSCHRYAKHLPTSPWRGAMSLPRELSVKQNSAGYALIQAPVRGLETLRDALLHIEPCTLISNHKAIFTYTQDRISLELLVEIDHTHAQECGLILQFAHTTQFEQLRIGFDATCNAVFVDRSKTGFQAPDDPTYPLRRYAPCVQPQRDAPLKLHLFVDAASVEVFVNDGELVFTEQFFAMYEPASLSLYSDGGDSAFGKTQIWPLTHAHHAHA